jgi:hypothetical protein
MMISLLLAESDFSVPLLGMVAAAPVLSSHKRIPLASTTIVDDPSSPHFLSNSVRLPKGA